MDAVLSLDDATPLALKSGARTGWRAHWINVLLLIAAVLIPVISYAGQLGLAPLAAILGLLCLPLLGGRRPPMLGLGVLLALAGWALVSLTWSVAAPVHPDFHRYKVVEGLTGLKLAFELALYGALVISLRDMPEKAAKRAMLVLAFGLCALAVVMSIDAVTNAGAYTRLRIEAHQAIKPEILRRNAARGTYTLALLYWPAMLRLRQAGQPILQAVLSLGLVIACLGLGVDAPLVAVFVSTVVFFGVRALGRGGVWALAGLVAAYFALTPVLVNLLPHDAHPLAQGAVVKASWLARLEIWRFVAALIPVHPMIGWGMDASRMWPAIPLHPHNAALQIWLELGAVGAAIAVVFWVWLFERIGDLAEEDRIGAATGAAAACAYLVIGALSFGVWQEWWLGLGALTVVVCAAQRAASVSVAAWPSAQTEDLIPLN